MEDEIINSFLTFEVNGGIYGIHVSKVVEIMAYSRPQAASGGIPALMGLVEHRGRVLPLIDSGLKFNTGAITLTDQTYVVVIAVRNGDELFDVALAVDMVREVIDIPEEDRLPIDSLYKPGYVSFASQTADGLAMILDPDKVFTDSEVVNMAEFTAQANKAAAKAKS